MDRLSRTGLGRLCARARRGRAAACAATALALMLTTPPHAIAARAKAVRASSAGYAAMSDVVARHQMRTLDGRAAGLESLRGQVVVLNFWASWCAPCRRELPALDALHKQISERGGRVLAVSIDRDVDNVRRFARAHGLGLPIVHDGPDGLARQLDLVSIPFTIVFDRGGQVALATSGSDPDAVARIAAMARELLAREPVAVRSPEGVTP